MNIEYKGMCKVEDFFPCGICGKQSREYFEATPSLPSLAAWDMIKCCKKCAQREVGSKRKKKLKAIMEKNNEKTQ